MPARPAHSAFSRSLPMLRFLLKGFTMLMPMKAPALAKRFVATMGVLLLAACSADVTAPPAPTAAVSTTSMFVPTESSKAMIGVVDGTYTVMVEPWRDQSFNFGPNHLDIPAGAVCMLGHSGYGSDYWDRPCVGQPRQFMLTVIIRNAATDHPSMDFAPAMRFSPSKTVQLFMYAPHVSQFDAINWKMVYCPNGGACFDESLTDQSLQTQIDYTNNVLFRRVKHFSGYTVAE